jgi:hypothetical protein
MDMPAIFDQQGEERNWDWLTANFGAVVLERAEAVEGTGWLYRIVKLQDAEGPAVQLVNVKDQDGNPLDGVRVVRHWPDAPVLPNWPLPASRWRDRGVYGETGVNGDVGFGMGHGDYYFPPTGGASAVWIASQDGPADLISGLGMLGGTNHRHLDVYYQLQSLEAEPPTPPVPQPTHPPSGEPWDLLLQKLDQIIDMLEQYNPDQ